MNKTLGERFYKILQQQKSDHSGSQPNLPSISLNQLQTKVNFFRKKKYEKQSLSTQIVNHKEINVSSPFYDRMKAHKQNCKCPYHRKKRFSLLPVRHTDKTGGSSRGGSRMRNSASNNDDHNMSLMHHNDRKSPHHLLNGLNTNILNSSFDYHNSHLSNTLPSPFKAKISTRNYEYEEFMKDCELYLLRKKGFSLGKPAHVVRKGVKQIFQFINKHLDYSVDRMTTWVGSVEKDKDYGEFYLERFREMKKNYELGIRKKMAKTELEGGSFSKFLSRTNNGKAHSDKFRLTNSQSSFAMRSKQSQKKLKNSHNQSYQEGQSNQDSNNQNSLQNCQLSLQRMIKQLKIQNKISQQHSQELMNMDISAFKELFNRLQANILNEKYTDQLLQKFDSGVLGELLKRYEENTQIGQIQSIKDLKDKLDIISKVQEVLKRHRTKRVSNFSDRNSYNMGSNSKGFQGSKRNTQNGENSKTSNSLYTHSKKSSGDCSLEGSSQNLCQGDDEQNENFYAIEEDQQDLDDDSTSSPQKILKALANYNQNVRRSRLLKGQEFNFNEENVHNDSMTDYNTDRSYDIEKPIVQPHKGFFTKAEKYLFDINMGKTIVKKDDSIFTAKRKMRVIKILLKQNPNAPQVSELQNYVKQIQEKILLKTQKDKKLALLKNSSQGEDLQDDEVWKMVSLDNLGYNLIFYNLSSKIRVQDNDDLCILLNEVRLNNQKKFDNKVSYKNHFFSDDHEETKKNKKKTQKEDILIQEGMNNMEFQPQIQAEKDSDQKNQTRRTTKTERKSLLQLTTLAKSSKMSGFFAENTFDFDLDELNDYEVQAYYQKLKKMFKYAKVHLPQTFDTFLKSSSVNQNSSYFQSSYLSNQNQTFLNSSMSFY